MMSSVVLALVLPAHAATVLRPQPSLPRPVVGTALVPAHVRSRAFTARLCAILSAAILRCAKKHADAPSQVLALRGGSNYPVALYGNGAVALAYASLMIFAPNTLLTAYGAPPEELLSAAYGALQYCGGFYAMVVLRAYAALTGKRDQGETVEAFTYLNATHLAIAAFRAFKGSSASLKNCAIFGTLLLLNWWAALE